MKNAMRAILLAQVLSIGTANSVQADEDDPRRIAEMAKRFGLISLEQAQSKALAAKPGVVKEVELDGRKFSKGWDYEFEIIDADGREWEVNIDAKTGVVTSVRRDWF
jgi:uncharacterized membrane protein YkoI